MPKEGHEFATIDFQLDRKRLQTLAERHASDYRSAHPFPHTVLDDFLPEEVIDTCLAEFPTPEQIDWRVLTDDGHSNKLATTDEALMGPATRQLIAQLNGGAMIDFLEKLTGIEGLVPDPHLVGGGLHQLPSGGFLDVHADFNFNERLKLDRRINLLLYLNPEWHDDWGGGLELWNPDLTECERRIAPIANRMVLFSTTDISFHGNPQPVSAPTGITRRSLALYYYTNGRPEHEGKEAHSTLYRVGAGRAAEVVWRPSLRDRIRAAMLQLLPPIIVSAARKLARGGGRRSPA